jgi:acetyltransferase-like isoleucine patch superfamily enzyme|tara:strand:- start:11950 stop:12501 length:552 start_codon:yes stop_codon:yes gene_type:complete
MKNGLINCGEDFYCHDDVYIKHISMATFGSHVALDKGFYCTTRLNIGDYVHIGPYVNIIGSIESRLILEDFSFIALGTKIIAGSDDYSASNLMGPLVPEKYTKKNNTTIKFEKFSGCGANCVIMPGVTLSEGSLLLAGTVMTKDTKPWMVYGGNPARALRQRDREKIYKQEEEIKKNQKENKK